MKHAGPEALRQLDPLLARVRRLGLLREKTPGSFYFKSSGILHFHEDPKGMFADLKQDGLWRRFAVNTSGEQKKLMQLLAREIGAGRIQARS